MKKIVGYTPFLLCVLIVGLMLAFPAFAQQDATAIVKAKTQSAYNLVYTGVYGLLGIGLIVCFLGALKGKMDWSQFAYACLAVVGVGSITALIQFFSP